MATKKELAAAAKAKKEAEKAEKLAKKEAEKKAKEEKAEEERLAKEEAKNGGKKKVETRHISELTKVDREALEAILRKEPSAIDDAEYAILKARAGYLSSDERKKYEV